MNDLNEEVLAKELEERERKQKEATVMTDAEYDAFIADIKHHPAFMKEFDPSKMNEATTALMALMYEGDDAKENAENYRIDGNKNFGLKKYRWAMDSYKEGIKCKAADAKLNAKLHLNKALCNMKLENYRSAVVDATSAIAFDSDYVKAFFIVADAHLSIGKYKEAEIWCERGLRIDDQHKQLNTLRGKITLKTRILARNERKDATKRDKEEEKRQTLLSAIHSRGVKMLDANIDYNARACVELDSTSGRLTWPVLLSYPEYQVNDIIEKFDESHQLIDHLGVVLACPADWDESSTYQIDKIDCFIENTVMSEDDAICTEIYYRIPLYATLGCGAGLLGITAAKLSAKSVHFADFNKDVLTRVTANNIYRNAIHLQPDDAIAEQQSKEGSVISDCLLLYGDWSDLIDHSVISSSHLYDIILTSETIYNPQNYSKLLRLFDTCLSLHDSACVYLAAKSHYFGVGGGVENFVAFVELDTRFKAETVFEIETNLNLVVLRLTRRGEIL